MNYFINHFIKKSINKIFYFISKYFLYFLVIFLCFLLFNSSPVHAFEYDATNWIQFKSISSPSYTYRVCCDQPFYIAPDDNDANYLSAYSQATNVKVKVNLYRNGVDYYNKSVSSQFLNVGNINFNINRTQEQWNSFFTANGNVEVYKTSSKSILVYSFNNLPVEPFLITSEENIKNFNFNYLIVNGGDLLYDDHFDLNFSYPNSDIVYTGNIDKYKTKENGQFLFKIPKNFFTSDIVLRPDTRFSLVLSDYHRESNAVTKHNYSLGTYYLTLTQEESDKINEDSNKELLGNISNQQSITNNKIDETNNLISNSDLDNDVIDLPTDSTNDITQDGINNIFSMIYNGFCEGTPKDIEIPIPFTNKSFIIPSNLTKNILSNTSFSFLNNLINAFWWYVISVFIISDITKKIDKIKSGDFEKIQDSNIKGDML